MSRLPIREGGIAVWEYIVINTNHARKGDDNQNSMFKIPHVATLQAFVWGSFSPIIEYSRRRRRK